jgi:hypothetical protein
LVSSVLLLRVPHFHFLHLKKKNTDFSRVRLSREENVEPFLCPSVCSHVSKRIPLDGFSSNFILETFITASQENSGLVTCGK